MNNQQENWPRRDTKRAEPEEAWINRLSAWLHGWIVRLMSHIRLSLTLRIAMHYSLQLLKTTFVVLLVLMAALCVAEAPSVASGLDALHNIQPAEGLRYSEEQLAALPISEAWLLAEPITPGIRGWGPKIGMFFSKWNTGDERCVVFYRETQTGSLAAAYGIDQLTHTMFVVFWAVLALELYRMIHFLRKSNKLKPVVVQPITDIAEKAAAISANNLGDRISVDGAKNELKDLALVINGMLDRIEVSYNSQKQFVSDASHELRTPIAVIQGYVNMLQRWGKSDKEVLEEGISAIEQEAAAMKELVERLLFLARHDKKTLMLEMESFDPLEVMSEIHREARMLSEEHKFELLPANNSRISADKDMIKQLMRILLDNAIKYTPAGGKITLGVGQDKNWCILTVTDTGAGISAEELPKVFDRFYRCDEARKQQTSGHGLGLSIARIIVSAHSGKLKVRSKVGVGTTFSVLLPLEKQ